MKHNNQSKRKFLSLFLSAMMICSAGAALAACNDTDSSSSSSSSSSVATKTDDYIIKNAGFETDVYKTSTPIITSVTGWTRSVNSAASGSALSSKAASGVIDTLKWAELTQRNQPSADFSTWSESKAAEEWDNLSLKDKLLYYQAWEKANKDEDKDVEDLDFYESFNVDLEDLPDCTNPKTHDWSETNAAKDDYNSNVLMIHNEYSNSTYDSLGTAQKFTSSTTVTVAVGTSVEFSLWVKTSNLFCADTNGNEQPAVNKGAYISITNSLGGTTFDPFEVKNINTVGVTDNNGWVKYQFYLKGSSFTDSTFKIVLGLGKSGGTDRSEYVNGYAFFDDVQCNVITNDEYDAAVTKADIDAGKTKVVYHDTELADKSVPESEENTYELYAIDFAATASSEKWEYLPEQGANEEYVLDGDWAFDPTTEKRNNTKYTAALDVTGAVTYPGLGISTANDRKFVKTKSEIAAINDNVYLQTAYTNYLADDDFIGDNDKILMLLSANGAAYDATSTATEVTLAPDEYVAVSFFVKTSDMNGYTGASATLYDVNEQHSLAAIDTTTIAGVEIGNDKDVYDGWVRCYFFVSNETDSEKSFSISFGYGPRTVLETTKSSYYAGFAAFTKFEMFEFTDKAAFDSAKSNQHAEIVSLKGKKTTETADVGWDSPAPTPTDAIKKGYADLQNYKGVYSDSDYVVKGDGTKTELNAHPSAGLLNKEYADNYDEILTQLGGTWASVFGNDTKQPLVIYNETAQDKAYGFIGGETSVATSSYGVIALRVKVSLGATASVYLTDADADVRGTTLSVNRVLTYWYDDDGNVCAKDPAAKDFTSKDVAFKLQPNGLYKVNTAWSGASSADANKYYANFSAYEKDAEGNYVVADGGVSYDYTDKWLNDGNDGIAFYYKDNKYYANSEKKAADEVLDLASVTSLTPRYTKVDDKALSVTLTGESAVPVWQTVIFYVHTSEKSKNYSLEVWSGTRDGEVKNGANSYVIFDSYTPGSVDDKFTELLTQRVEEIDENAALGEYIESVYSFYDQGKFLRYDETLDKNEVGDSYESYVSSAYASGVAYLKYDKGDEHEIYADYAYSDTVVEEDKEEEDVDVEEETPTDTMNVALLVSSILVAVALLFAVVSLIVRRILQARRRKRNVGALAKAVKSKSNKSEN